MKSKSGLDPWTSSISNAEQSSYVFSHFLYPLLDVPRLWRLASTLVLLGELSLSNFIRRSNPIIQLDEYIVYCLAFVYICNVVLFNCLDVTNAYFSKGSSFPVLFFSIVVVVGLQQL
jgi:hypothetical protein